MKRHAFASFLFLALSGLLACGEQKEQTKRTPSSSSEMQKNATEKNGAEDRSQAAKDAAPSSEDNFIPLPEETLTLITMNEETLQSELERAIVIDETVYTSGRANVIQGPSEVPGTESNGGVKIGHGVDAGVGVAIGGGGINVGVHHDAGVELAPGAVKVDSRFSVEVEIGKVFRKFHQRYPGAIGEQDSLKLQLELRLFIDASVNRDTRLATHHWNKFLRIVADIEAQKRSFLQNLIGFIPKVAQATANLLRLATELVAATIAFNVDSFNKVLEGLAETVFILVR